MKKVIESLPQEYKDTMIVIPVGPTAIIDKSLGCCQVYHVIGDKDWPSQKCNGGEGGLHEAGENANIRIIEQIETKPGVSGHYFVQPDYQKEIIRVFEKEIQGNYNVY